MHDMNSFHVRNCIVWNVNGWLCVITCTFRWGVTPIGEFNYRALLTLSWEIISGTEGTPRDETYPRPQLLKIRPNSALFYIL